PRSADRSAHSHRTRHPLPTRRSSDLADSAPIRRRANSAESQGFGEIRRFGGVRERFGADSAPSEFGGAGRQWSEVPQALVTWSATTSTERFSSSLPIAARAARPASEVSTRSRRLPWSASSDR